MAAPPSKWHLARVGALTAFLGAGAGWSLASAPAPEVRVPGASWVRATCAGFRAEVDGDRIPLAGTSPCSVEARFADGPSARAELRVTLRGTQTCRVTGEVLRCAPSWR